MVQEGALTAIAAVADCAEEAFVPYYDVVMPYLVTVLTQVGGNAQVGLWLHSPQDSWLAAHNDSFVHCTQ